MFYFVPKIQEPQKLIYTTVNLSLYCYEYKLYNQLSHEQGVITTGHIIMHTKLFNCSSYKVVISCNCYCEAPIWPSYEPFNTHVPTYVYEALCLTAQLKALNLHLLWNEWLTQYHFCLLLKELMMSFATQAMLIHNINKCYIIRTASCIALV